VKTSAIADKQTPTLSEHLAAYGLRDFYSSDRYLRWAYEQLGEQKAERLDSLRKPLARDDVKPDDVLRFYDYIAEPAIAAVVHSMKTDVIRASGEAVWECIKDRKKIIDLGCNIGYLTTWYAAQGDNSVTGVDVSERSIKEASKKANELHCTNVRFVQGDIRKLFRGERCDCIVDTQTLYTVAKQKQTLAHLYSILDDNGLLVSIPPIRTPEKIKTYLGALTEAGFHVQALEFIYFSNLGVVETYPLIKAGEKPSEAGAVDVESAYLTMRSELLALKN
jgi:2-polyprenyl-3-methyl-5-hydroxy-6-metoxy-1,4-benzoquinol methylase